jgi:GNAT superfamily N-acetyltransferase
LSGAAEVVDTKDDPLREMAEHRGLKLVKSRRRKPGVGDYGKYGLTDSAGKALFGIGSDSLTASAEEIEAYLRGNALGTWKESASATPDRPESRSKPAASEVKEEHRKIRATPSTSAVRRSRDHTEKAVEGDPVPKPPRSGSEPKTNAKPEPRLIIRPAKPADASQLAALLGQLNGISIDEREVRKNLEVTRRAGGGMLLADLDGLVGCCGWAVVATVHRGPVGRVTALFVEDGHRRKAIATRMIGEAADALAKRGCVLIEAMSDIEIKNAHNFFRALKFEQASYRFTRSAGTDP